MLNEKSKERFAFGVSFFLEERVFELKDQNTCSVLLDSASETLFFLPF